MDFINAIKKWFELKVKLWTKKNRVVFKQGDIWWCSLGFNIGEEIFGKGEKFTRPVLIFKKFTRNSFMGLPPNKIGSMNKADFEKVKKRFIEFYGS